MLSHEPNARAYVAKADDPAKVAFPAAVIGAFGRNVRRADVELFSNEKVIGQARWPTPVLLYSWTFP